MNSNIYIQFQINCRQFRSDKLFLTATYISFMYVFNCAFHVTNKKQILIRHEYVIIILKFISTEIISGYKALLFIDQ